MNYISTRGFADKTNFSGTVLTGLASDGGLFMPSRIPVFSEANLRAFSRMNCADVAFCVLRAFAPEIATRAIRKMIQEVYNPRVFTNAIDGNNSAVMPIRELSKDRYLLEISNGPTLSFKDVALQLLGLLFEYVLCGKSLNILGATSGDTGSAAIHGVLGRKGIKIFMLHPLGRTSPLQAAQMCSVISDQVFNIAIHGTFDDGQAVVKSIFGDAEFKQKYNLGAVNSINWARVAAQVVYYIYASTHVVKDVRRDFVDVAIGAGNFGNTISCIIAKRMGAPIRYITAATNSNDMLHRVTQTGIYRPSKEVIVTASPSMDIQGASNFERYVHLLTNGDSERVRTLYDNLKHEGEYDISDLLQTMRDEGFSSERVSEGECFQTMQDVYKSDDYMLDPHTSVGVCAANRKREDGVPILIPVTAQPCKFDIDVEKNLGVKAPRPASLVGIEDLPQKYIEVDPDPQKVKEIIEMNA